MEEQIKDSSDDGRLRGVNSHFRIQIVASSWTSLDANGVAVRYLISHNAPARQEEAAKSAPLARAFFSQILLITRNLANKDFAPDPCGVNILLDGD